VLPNNKNVVIYEGGRRWVVRSPVPSFPNLEAEFYV
jgi:hypothetical protein